GYKKVLDYIREKWLVNNQAVDIKTITTLHSTFSAGKFTIPEIQVKQVLDYLRNSTDSPIIQSAIGKFAFLALSPFPSDNEISSTLYSYVFLYKAGFDFRGLLVLERQFAQEKDTLLQQY